MKGKERKGEARKGSKGKERKGKAEGLEILKISPKSQKESERMRRNNQNKKKGGEK
jgi:hypothetical protein